MNRLKNSWKYSIKAQQIIIFSVLISITLLFSTLIYWGAATNAKNAIYDKMNSKVEFYVQSMEEQVNAIRTLQTNFFTDRKLPFLISDKIILSDYDKRDALLTELEHVRSVKDMSSYIKQAILYIPGLNYRISENGVRTIAESDLENIREYTKYLKNVINYVDGKLFLVSAGSGYIYGDKLPDFLFVINLDIARLESSITDFNTIDEAGSFLFNKENKFFIKSKTETPIDTDIIDKLIIDDNGNYKQTQVIKVDKKNYLISVVESNLLGIFVQYYSEDVVMKDFKIYHRLQIAFILCFVFLAFAFATYTEKTINHPLKKLERAFLKLEDGNLDVEISHNRNDEFAYIYEGFNHMTKKMKILIKDIFVQKDLKQRAELKQLQAQINPHFLYNNFFILSRRIKRGDLEGAEELSKYLGNYFQYLTRNKEDCVPLSFEIKHARSYTNIQAIRFAGRLKVMFDELPMKYENLIVPRLILQPIIENAFEHGLEDKEENGLFKISYEIKESYLFILIEDNGDGFTKEKLEDMEKMLSDEKEGEITGIININKRLKAFLGHESGLEISQSDIGGVGVKIKLPITEEL